MKRLQSRSKKSRPYDAFTSFFEVPSAQEFTFVGYNTPKPKAVERKAPPVLEINSLVGKFSQQESSKDIHKSVFNNKSLEGQTFIDCTPPDVCNRPVPQMEMPPQRHKQVQTQQSEEPMPDWQIKLLTALNAEPPTQPEPQMERWQIEAFNNLARPQTEVQSPQQLPSISELLAGSNVTSARRPATNLFIPRQYAPATPPTSNGIQKPNKMNSTAIKPSSNKTTGCKSFRLSDIFNDGSVAGEQSLTIRKNN